MSCAGPSAPPPKLSLATVLRAALSGAWSGVPQHHWRILNALLACRTANLGGHRYRCQDCGRQHFAPHSCRNRHCPLCQGAAAQEWLAQQQLALLPVPYFHVVFTLPHVLNPLIQQNQRTLYNLLFTTVSQTLLEFGQQRFGVQLGVTTVLHTWGQNLLDHYHLHCIVTGGGLSPDGSKWVGSSPHYLFPVRALAVVFRGQYTAGLQRLHAAGQLHFYGQLQSWAQPQVFQALLGQAVQKPWVVYAKQPFAGPKQVLAYLSRYTHRVALSPARLLALDGAKGTVTFSWKDYAHGSARKTMTLALAEFLRRFCLHLLPERFVKIRHFGFLSNRQRRRRLAQARALFPVLPLLVLSAGSPDPAPKLPRCCPHCGSTRLKLLEILAPPTTQPDLPLDSS